MGVISAFIVYAKQFSRPINEIAQIYGQLQTAVAGAERVFAVLNEETEDKSGGTLETGEKAAVTFQNVCFSYEAETPVIRNFTLTVPNGRKVALVGATGSGKTTIVNLLMRFYDIESGEIRINGQDIHDVSDLIVVMERGEIAESGSHEELLAKKGRYYELYMTQYAGFAT